MSRFGSQHRTDENQSDVVKELRKVIGTTVAITNGAGEGFPDLVVGRELTVKQIIAIYGEDGVVPMNFLLEVKPEKRNKHRPKQLKFRKAWHGQIATVTDASQALATIGVYKNAGNYQRAGTNREAECEGGV